MLRWCEEKLLLSRGNVKENLWILRKSVYYLFLLTNDAAERGRRLNAKTILESVAHMLLQGIIDTAFTLFFYFSKVHVI